jgi:hypothetical protein
VRTRQPEIAPRISHVMRAVGAAAPGTARRWIANFNW